MRFEANVTGGQGFGNRIWLEKEFDENGNLTDRYRLIRQGLNKLSCWGGADKEGRNYEAWEFSWLPQHKDNWPEALKILEHFGCIEERFDKKMFEGRF